MWLKTWFTCKWTLVRLPTVKTQAQWITGRDINTWNFHQKATQKKRLYDKLWVNMLKMKWKHLSIDKLLEKVLEWGFFLSLCLFFSPYQSSFWAELTPMLCPVLRTSFLNHIVDLYKQQWAVKQTMNNISTPLQTPLPISCINVRWWHRGPKLFGETSLIGVTEVWLGLQLKTF